MAETAKRSNTTDKLVIDIKVNVKKGATAQIANLTKSLTKLNEVVKNTANIEKYANALKTIGKELTRTTANKGVSQAQLGNKNYTEQTDVKLNDTKAQTEEEAKSLQNQKSQLDNLKSSYEEVDKSKAKLSTTTEILKDGTKREVNVYTEYIKGLKRTTREINGMVVSQKTQAVQTKKNTSIFSKFVRSLGRIALYRAIRAGLSLIVKTAKEGLSYFVQYDDATNKAMSNIVNSGNQIKATLGATLGNLLTSLEPIITTLSDAMVGLFDNINKAMALMQDDTSYKKAIKNNKDYADSLKETNNQLLSFDKFESLGKAEDKQDYEDVDITKEEADAISPLTEIFTELKETLGEIFATIGDIIIAIKPLWDVLSPIVSKVLTVALNIIQKILPLLSKIISVVTQIVTIALDLFSPVINGIFDLLEGVVGYVIGILDFLVGIISGFLKLFTGDFEEALHDVANGFASMINGIVNMFIEFANFFIGVINTLIKPVDWLVKAFGGSGLQIPTISWNMDWQPYAEGGMVEKGTRFIAGEAGAEVVHTSARGTGVTNIEQFSQAMLQALATYGVARGSDVSFKGDVYIDRTKAGQLLEGSVYGEGVRVGHFKRV
jgi:hypothetical protein